MHEPKLTRGWVIPRYSGRQYLFLPEAKVAALEKDAADVEQKWHAKFLEHRSEQASALFDLAKSELQAGRAARAYQLLHEVLHHTVFETRHPRVERALALAYAIPSGIAASQFTRWHLDHHAELGSDLDDPKRHYLSPKRVERWYKLLYATPALFPIYFRAAAKETATYPDALRRTIAWERKVSMAFHVSVAALIWWGFGWAAAWRADLFPVFFVFPIAFTLNRLGQHYDIDPSDPAKWGTLMRGNWFWDFVYLYSNYHLEHHYFPGVPCYRLPALQNALKPFYAERGMHWMSYSKLVYGWIVLNKTPHTDWDLA